MTFFKRRSNSESRSQSHVPVQNDEIEVNVGRRKTSAELISEVKSFLGDVKPIHGQYKSNETMGISGLRLISTRRPLTPHEPTRSLYGKVALPGRPPSAFSMKYLQKEGSRMIKTPPLEPLNHKPIESRYQKDMTTKNQIDLDKLSALKSPVAKATIFNFDNSARKLPALELEPKEQQTVKFPKTQQTKIIEDNLTTEKPLLRHNDLLGQSTTERLVELLKDYAGLKDCNEETVAHINAILIELYERVRNNKKQYKRASILGGIYGLVECSSPKILLAVARVVLALRVSGSNLTGACKLIFKVARNEKNDQYFHQNDVLELFIEGLGRANPVDDAEACIYGYGSIRFLTTKCAQERSELTKKLKGTNKNWSEWQLEVPANKPTMPTTTLTNKLNRQNRLAEYLARYGAVDLMTLHLQLLNEAGATEKLSGPPLHSLYQLSAALRAFAHISNENVSLKLNLACPHLIRAAEVSLEELEIQANIIRTLSVLSEDVKCCELLTEYTARIGMLMGSCCQMFKSAPEKPLALCSRLAYILGNIMASFDEARIQFYHNDVSMEYLLSILELCLKHPLTLKTTQGDSVCDVMIKIMRVIANMSVNAEVGLGLCNTNNLGKYLIEVLKLTYQTKTLTMQAELIELTHGTLGSLHNLCFYQENNHLPSQVLEFEGSLQTVLPQLATELCDLLRHRANADTICVETIRVLGNLTRNENARHYFCQKQGLLLLVDLLSNMKAPYDMKTCTMGVLVNVLGDWQQRAPFMQLSGIQILYQELSTALQTQHWILATITCHALWNLFIDISAPDLLTSKTTAESEILYDLNDLLANNLDEEIIFDKEMKIDASWEEFAIVATDLIDRLQTVLIDKETPTTTPIDEALLSEIRYVNSNNKKDDEDDIYIEEIQN